MIASKGCDFSDLRQRGFFSKRRRYRRASGILEAVSECCPEGREREIDSGEPSPYGERSQRPEAGGLDMRMALAYSKAYSSLPGYCSLNSRNNLCANSSCFSRRAARARIILAKGRR